MDTSSKPPAGPYDDLVEKYRPKYSDEWVNKRVPIIIEEVSRAAQTRDYSYLVNLRFPDTSAFSRAVFTRITGIALHRTQHESLRIIREFVGDEVVQAYHQEAAKQHEERKINHLENCLGRQMQTPYGLVSMSDFIQKLIADGYNAIVARSRGAATEWFLFNDDGSGYVFRRRDEHEYIELMLARRTRTETPEEPAEAAKVGVEHVEQ